MTDKASKVLKLVQDRAHGLAITVEEAAEILGISRAFAYALVRRDELPSLRLGRRLVIPRRALEQLVEGEDHDRGHRMQLGGGQNV